MAEELQLLDEQYSTHDIGFKSIVMRHLDRISQITSTISQTRESDYSAAVSALERLLLPFHDGAYKKARSNFLRGWEARWKAQVLNKKPVEQIKKRPLLLVDRAETLLGLLQCLLDRMGLLLEGSETLRVGEHGKGKRGP